MLKQKKNKFVLGVTGNIACGKSTVAAMFKTKSVELLDADALAHALYSTGSSVYKKIVKYFGRDILTKDNLINRKKLARAVFINKLALARLNSITHPVLIREIKQRIKNSNKKIIILDAALIIEAGLRKTVDKLVVVTAKDEQQVLRSQRSLGLKKNQLRLRMKSQISQEAKANFADFIIDNSQTIEKTKKQVSQIRRKLWKS